MSDMGMSHQTQAVLLLTAHFGKPAKGDPKPLTTAEWGRFAQWLREHQIQPDALLLDDPAVVLVDWRDRMITLERINYLLSRSGALGLAVEKWERAGLWVLPRSDPRYPSRLKKLLKNESPAVLFGCGNPSLLNQGGIAVIGSRDAGEAELAFTTALAGDAARQGVSIISGGARGVDEVAMLGALQEEGTVVGVLADSLLRAATSAKYRSGLMTNKLVLVSPFNPEAGFDVGNAMSRNKYIYCLADAAIVIATGKGKGGTWNGAVENLKARWVPLWVKRHPDAASGNAALVQQGAGWLPEHSLRFADLCDVAPAPELFDLPAEDAAAAAEQALAAPSHPDPALDQPQTTTAQAMSFYDLFLQRLEQLTTDTPVTVEQLSAALEVNKAQVGDWLKRALEGGYVIKLSKPVRYQWLSLRPQQPSLLADEQDANKSGALSDTQ